MQYKSKARLVAEKIIEEEIKREGKISFPIAPFKILKERNIIIV